MTWLVLGANGQLGQELINLLKRRNIEAIGTDRTEIDLAKPIEIAEKLGKLNPSHIVNCGAYTQVDKAEEEPELANLINAQAVGVISKFASASSSRLTVISPLSFSAMNVLGTNFAAAILNMKTAKVIRRIAFGLSIE